MPFDAHIHLDQYEHEHRSAMLQAAFAQGVEGMVSVSMEMASCEENRLLAAEYPGRILPAYGHHPEQEPLSEGQLTQLCEWIRRLPDSEPFAIGEVGLPYFARKEAEAKGRAFDLAPYVRQLEAFMRLAAQLDRPLALHAVHEDADLVLDMLADCNVRRAHFHWFKGSPDTVRRITENGYFISITPEVLYDEETRSLARTVPLHSLLVETDGPWPFEGPYEGRRTEPAMVLDVTSELARLRSIAPKQAREIMLANVRRCYGNLS